MRIFVDLDGVLADFVGGALETFNQPSPWSQEKNLGNYEIDKLLNLSTTKFWEPLNSHAFWASLDKLIDGFNMLEYLETYYPQGQIYISTSPTLSPESSSGKHEWIAKHLPKYSRRTFIGPIKEVFAEIPNSILIDDSDSNVEKFIAAGGNAILWPQPWNSAYNYRGAKQSYLVHKMSRWLSEDIQ